MMSERWITRRRVPESDPVYQSERKRWSEVDNESRVLARTSLSIYERQKSNKEGVIELIQQDTNELVGLGEQESERKLVLEQRIQRRELYAQQQDKEKADFLREDLQKFFIDFSKVLDRPLVFKEKSEVIIPEVKLMLADPEVQDELRRVFGDDLSKLTPTDLLMKIIDKGLSDECLYRMAKAHNERVKQQEEELAQFVEQTKAEFTDAISKAVEAGWLPPSAKEALPRVGQIVVRLKDLLSNMEATSLGDSDETGRISVNSFQLRPERFPLLRIVLFHEFLHELSGKSISVKTKVHDQPYEINQATHRKVGVALKPEYAGYAPNKWLNEAITEWLALRLSGFSDEGKYTYKGSGSYIDERRELDRLMSLGLEEGVITQAYFENFSSEQPHEELGQHYVALVKRIKELEGPEGFLKLDNTHMMNEAEQFLMGVSAYPESMQPASVEVPANGKMFVIHVQMGGAQAVRVKRDFVYTARPIVLPSFTITAEEQWARTKQAVEALPYQFGANKVSYSIEEKLAA